MDVLEYIKTTGAVRPGSATRLRFRVISPFDVQKAAKNSRFLVFFCRSFSHPLYISSPSVCCFARCAPHFINQFFYLSARNGRPDLPDVRCWHIFLEKSDFFVELLVLRIFSVCLFQTVVLFRFIRNFLSFSAALTSYSQDGNIYASKVHGIRHASQIILQEES
ncbi:MAG: hypothetical protein MR018_09685, partial [Clostridiales bacterium]|nr:hypothetical protein [Clostridiales bacterium]